MYFESNILYPKEYKRDYIKVDDSREIHYVISTNQQQSRWHIAINLINTDLGGCVQRNDLSKVVTDYSQLMTYLQHVRNLILNPRSPNREMLDEFIQIELKLSALVQNLIQFKRRFIQE